jgi:hypothetical protein
MEAIVCARENPLMMGLCQETTKRKGRIDVEMGDYGLVLYQKYARVLPYRRDAAR